MTEEQSTFESFAILEVMGHRRLGGFVRAVQIAGAGFFRIDIPGDVDGETHSTQFYPPASVYCLTPVSEEAAKVVARSSRTPPVHQWELPAATTSQTRWPMCSNCDERHDPDGPCDDDDDDDR